jgi:hypothetical protein
MKCTSSDHTLAEVPAVEVVNNGYGTLGLHLLVYFLYHILQGASPVSSVDSDADLLLAHPFQEHPWCRRAPYLEMYTTMDFSAIKKSMTVLLLV